MDLLSPREREIVRIKCTDDLTARGVGVVLGISGQTVKNHITAVMRKLRCASMHRVCMIYGVSVTEGPVTKRSSIRGARADEV